MKIPRLPNGQLDEEAYLLLCLKATKAILYWSETYRPQDFVGRPNPRAAEVAEILRKPDQKMGYMGYASCRICNEILGSHDFAAHGFAWPEKAEHYILVHALWTPELNDLLAASEKA